MRKFILLLLLLALTSVSARASSRVVSVMAPLYIGDMGNPSSDRSKQEWRHFRESLQSAKKAGVDAVTTDVWWGLVQASSPASFNWAYYHRMSAEIRAAGLKWIPILSTHACGGNVGDTVNIPLPKWVWSAGAAGGHSIKFKSEGGNESDEYVSFWDTPKVLDYYKNFYTAFRDEFKADADIVSQIIVGLGPSGEIHYPSYHSHDRNLWFSGYPNRGALQASSSSAQESFQSAMFAKYGSLEAMAKAWSRTVDSNGDVHPPRTTPEVDRLLSNNGAFSAYGQDVFDWYRGSMLEHSQLVGGEAMKIFGEGPFAHTAVGFKLPGVHWSMISRFAELTSGLISTRQPEAGAEWNHKHLGMGYRAIFQMLAGLQAAHRAQPVEIYFTAGMTPNGNDSNMGDQSRAQDLTKAAAVMAREYHLRSGIENALDSDLANPAHVELLKADLRDGGYDSASLLRIDDVLASGVLRQAIPEIHSYSPFKNCELQLTAYPGQL